MVRKAGPSECPSIRVRSIPAQLRAKATRTEILGAVARVVARDGIAGATTASIATEAEVSTGTFYRYFRDLQDAIDELASVFAHDAAQAFAGGLGSTGTPQERMESAIRALTDQFTVHAGFLGPLGGLLLSASPSGHVLDLSEAIQGFINPGAHGTANEVSLRMAEAMLLGGCMAVANCTDEPTIRTQLAHQAAQTLLPLILPAA